MGERESTEEDERKKMERKKKRRRCRKDKSQCMHCVVTPGNVAVVDGKTRVGQEEEEEKRREEKRRHRDDSRD
jgi:hypothetical protein